MIGGATRLQLTDRGFEVRRVVKELQGVLVERMGRNGVTPDVLRGGAKALEQIERTWTDYVRYGPD